MSFEDLRSGFNEPSGGFSRSAWSHINFGVTHDDPGYSGTDSANGHQGCHLDEEGNTDSGDGYQCDYSDGEER